MKIVFSIINGLLVILGLLYFLLILQTRNFENLVLPAFVVVIFALNTLAIWQPFKLWISAIQFLFTLIIIPVIHLIFAISLPFVIALAKIDNPQLDVEQFSKVGWILYVTSALMLLSALNIIYVAYQDRKNSKI